MADQEDKFDAVDPGVDEEPEATEQPRDEQVLEVNSSIDGISGLRQQTPEPAESETNEIEMGRLGPGVEAGLDVTGPQLELHGPIPESVAHDIPRAEDQEEVNLNEPGLPEEQAEHSQDPDTSQSLILILAVIAYARVNGAQLLRRQEEPEQPRDGLVLEVNSSVNGISGSRHQAPEPAESETNEIEMGQLRPGVEAGLDVTEPQLELHGPIPESVAHDIPRAEEVNLNERPGLPEEEEQANRFLILILAVIAYVRVNGAQLLRRQEELEQGTRNDGFVSPSLEQQVGNFSLEMNVRFSWSITSEMLLFVLLALAIVVLVLVMLLRTVFRLG